MAPETSPETTRSRCETRIAGIEQGVRRLWMPGRRGRLVAEWYDVGYESREIGAHDLAEKCFRAAIGLMHGRRPWLLKRSLRVFSVVAGCYNLLGDHYLHEQRWTEAATSFDEAIKVRRRLRRLFPTDRENAVYLGGALCNRGHATAQTDAKLARDFYEQSLAVLRQPIQTCACSYWDEPRQSWWCEQLEALGPIVGAQWVELAPRFIDNAADALRALAESTDAPHRGGTEGFP
ncbi:MAG: tetratricopeptide repeat protein [Planctomycetia bacterium]